MTTYTQRADLSVALPIAAFADTAVQRSGRDLDGFWAGVSDLVHRLGPRNEELLRVRDRMQHQLDDYHRAHPGPPDPDRYRAFLREIGYLVAEPEPFTIGTRDVDPEIAVMAGPQLVVPLLNARFALNAANARWGSLYDALYGTDAVAEEGGLGRGGAYNPERGAAVIRRGRLLLDQVAALVSGSHANATGYRVRSGRLVVVIDGEEIGLADPSAFCGFAGDEHEPRAVLVAHHGLRVEIAIDRAGRIGATDPAGIDDLVIESALTTIMDLEDSVAAVDADDKALGYRNWQGLMDGTLSERVDKGGRTLTRVLAEDRAYVGPDGTAFTVPGRSVLFVRNVGHLMRTDAVLDRSGTPVFEGILDAVMTALGSLADLGAEGSRGNSRTGSMYIVKPKMHGPDEAAFAADLFAGVEEVLDLAPNTLKIGLMDEERRTSVNLAACIRAVSDRLVFINTGFLDRTGDEIHTSLHAGVFLPKADIRSQPWLSAYEERNVRIGVDCGLDGRAQIGKGMWAMPDLMHDMLEQKIAHVRTGASTAWVPSPTAATLHALHYHEADPFAVRSGLSAPADGGLGDLLTLPLADPDALTAEVVARELDHNVQSILGYVSRWIDQGIGCSKVPDISGTALMEDRATLRISSQLLANWLHHGVVSVEQVEESLIRLSAVVDAQNSADPAYRPLREGDGPHTAWEVSRRLIVDGAAQPNGYTEPLLHEYRRRRKAQRGTPAP